MHLNQRRRLLGALTATLVALSGVAATQAASDAKAPSGSHTARQPAAEKQLVASIPLRKKHKRHHRLMKIQLLSFNDFHGNLEPPSGSSGSIVTGHALDPVKGTPVNVTQSVGGVEYLATHLAQARRGHRNSLTVAAGDIIGASPLLSAAFHDEPTIEAMNTLGLDVTAVGNHEFDEGYRELQRMQYGGCIDDGDGANNQNSCPAGVFLGANFPMLAANVTYAGSNKTILPAYAIKKVHGAKIGFIGMTLKDTPSIVTASGVQGLQFHDEIATANALVPVLRKQGVKAIIVLIHQGGVPAKQSWTDGNGKTWSVDPTWDYACKNGGTLDVPSSPILEIAAKLKPQIDMVISGHTHQPYVCSVRDPKGHRRLLTSASSFGRLFTETTLKYDKRKGDIVRASVKGANFPVTRDVPKDPAESSLIAKYLDLVRPVASRVIGHITEDVTKTANAAGESQLGDLIADAQLADTSTITGGQTPVIAFMNPGGIRADLTFASSKYGEAPGDVTYEEAFNVQPFNNYLVSLTLTGQDIYNLLAQQVTGPNAGSKKVLQVSHGFTYQLGPSGAVDGTVKLDNVAIDKAATYRVVTNNFLADGGDNFPAFRNGTGKYFGGLDIDAFADYLAAHNPYTPGPLTRITQ
ncbi:MAG TPA: bifunctional metallophosphatase/5'-nucleotidase [Marmoricola sp.]|nr:bifunctional metallophosphatase/5'-nucleotidase [Marmoricola sp.]